MKKIFFLFVLSFIVFSLKSQDDYPLKTRYPFVDYEKNKFEYPGDKSAFVKLFQKFDTLILFGTNKLTVLQFGASHTQADLFTGRLRMSLQNMYPGLNAGRGFVFPYNLIRTNSPNSYYASHTGTWTVCRNVDYYNCLLGVTGIVASTQSLDASITISLRDNPLMDYKFNYVRVLHAADTISFAVTIPNDSLIDRIETNYEAGYTDIYLKDYVQEITIKTVKQKPSQIHFDLYGIFLENTFPGIVFNPIGINGASTDSYLKCTLLEQQLKVVNPDWVIFALGTNDGYTYSFDSLKYQNNLISLIKRIKSVKPDIAITLIVPNDDYYRKKYPNRNTAIQANIIKIVAQKEGASVWNMYEIMGGLNSSSLWYQYGLMQYDRIHFTTQGYFHLADLFFTALIDSYGEFMNGAQ